MTVGDYFNEERQKLDLEDKISKEFLHFIENEIYTLIKDDQYLLIIYMKNEDRCLHPFHRMYAKNRIESHYLNDLKDFAPKYEDNYPVLFTIKHDDRTFWELLPHDICKHEIVFHINTSQIEATEIAIEKAFMLFYENSEWSPVKVEFPGKNGEMIDFRTVELTEKQKNIELDF